MDTSWRRATAYVVGTTATAWGIWMAGSLVAAEIPVTFVLAGAWVPTAVAIGATYRTEGQPGVRALLARLVRWRLGWRWYAVAVLSVPAIVGVAVSLHVLLGGAVPTPTFPVDLSGDREYLLVPVVFLVNVFVGGPLAEEVGWRGYLQPVLNRSLGVLPAGAGVGLVWGLWHLPFFFLPGGSAIVGDLPLLWFVPLVTGWSVIVGWLVTRAGSLLLAVLFHASINTTLGTLGVLNGPVRLRALTVAVTAVVLAGMVLGLRADSRDTPR